MILKSQAQLSSESDKRSQWIASCLLIFAAIMLALHYVHLTADPPWRYYPGHFRSMDWSGDLYTDEGWELHAAAEAATTGHWYVPGDLNLAVDAPFFPILLYFPFKLLGVGMWIARVFVLSCYSASVGMIYLFLKGLTSRLNSALVVALLSINFLAFAFSRTAFVEPVMTFFVVASLLAAKRAATNESKLLSLFAGLILSLGVLTKLTALSGAPPLLAVLWLLSTSRLRNSKCIVAILGILPLPLLHRFLIMTKYKKDHDFYVYLDITSRAAKGLKGWFSSITHVAIDLHFVGPLLYLAFLVSVVVFFVSRKQPLDILSKTCFIWFLSSTALFISITYFPPRYCVSILLPLVILTVQLTASISIANKVLGRCLYGLIAASLILDTGQIVAYSIKPHFTYAGFAEKVIAAVPPDSRKKCAMIGDMANTVSLYTGIPSVNLTTGAGTEVERIEQCDPSILLANRPLDDDAMAALRKTHRSITLEQNMDVLGNYNTGLPISIYRINKDR